MQYSTYLSAMFKGRILFYKCKFLLSLIIMLWSCGQRGSPSGGIKDNMPPEIIKSIPDSCGLNFNGKKISWVFDEYVTLSGLNKELLISPPIKTKPKHKLTGKKLTLIFDTIFNPNTTYTIFLGKGIKDLNEGNPLIDNLLVFSTGEIIDSLSFQGEIYDAESMEEVKDGMVHLYKKKDDSIPSQKIPAYFAKVENGHFKFNNLAEGSYKLFYLKDNNGNYLYDLPNERIAFHNSSIDVTDQIDSSKIILKSFLGEEKKQFILESKCDFRGKLQLKFNLPVSEFKIELESKKFKKDWKILNWNENKDSLVIWSSEIQTLDSARFFVEYDGQVDTLIFDLLKRKLMNTQEIAILENFTAFGNYYKNPFEFSFSQPISSYDTSKTLIIGAGDSTQAAISYSDKGLTNFKLDWTLKENSNYKLIFFPNAIRSIFGSFNNDTITIDFTTALNSLLGNLTINYDFEQANKQGILQVYFEKKFKTEIFVTNNKGRLMFEGAKPGNYQLKYIADTNNDKKWTPGNYWENKQPENIYWYNQSITLRNNWDLDVEWVLSLEEN